MRHLAKVKRGRGTATIAIRFGFLGFGDTVHCSRSFSGGSVRRRSGGLKSSSNPGNIQQHEILVRWLSSPDRLNCEKPNKIRITLQFLSPVNAVGSTTPRGQRAEQDCPGRDPPASMAIGFHRKHHTGEQLAGSPPSVTRESVWRFSQAADAGQFPPRRAYVCPGVPDCPRQALT